MTAPLALVLALTSLPVVLGLGARFWASNTFARADRMTTAAGVTGSQAAARLLAVLGCAHVGVEIEGEAGDHYDPSLRVVRLTEPVAASASVAALAVAAHEVAHAAQDHERDPAFRLRQAIAPAASLCARGWLPLVVVGIVLGSVGLVGGAFVLFALVAAFHVATLPVELDASRRALSLLAGEGLLVEDELPPARGVLRAAASTYLVAALVAAAEVVWLLLELTGEDD